jgi:hypothetical protein
MPILVLSAVSLGLFSSCTQFPSSLSEPAQAAEPAQVVESDSMVDSGSWYAQVDWPHDGNPYESQNFIVFSDAASQEARQSAADIGEELLTKLIADFSIVEDEMFRFPEDQEKIHIYVYKNRNPWWGGKAYHAGVIVWSLDNDKRSSDLDIYVQVIEHELVHVVEALLKGRFVGDIPVAMRVEMWFSEGLAEVTAGRIHSGPRSTIRDLNHLNFLTDKYGQLSPIAFETDSHVMALYNEEELKLAYAEYHYPMYQLAVEYLLDAEGLGNSPQDARDIFLDMAEGSTFPAAFERHMGISTMDYEEQFFDLMNDFLREKSGALIRIQRMSLAWLVLTAGSLIILAWDLARGTRASGRIRLAWVLVTVLFGPLGLLGYLLSSNRPGRQASSWGRALGASLYSVTGNALGLMPVVIYLYFFVPAGDAGPMILLAPLLVGWLFFRAPLLATRPGGSYWVALRRTLLTEIISTILVMVGMLSVLIILPKRWYFTSEPSSPYFWVFFLLGAIVGALILYPYNVWMERRGTVLWR